MSCLAGQVQTIVDGVNGEVDLDAGCVLLIGSLPL